MDFRQLGTPTRAFLVTLVPMRRAASAVFPELARTEEVGGRASAVSPHCSGRPGPRVLRGCPAGLRLGRSPHSTDRRRASHPGCHRDPRRKTRRLPPSCRRAGHRGDRRDLHRHPSLLPRPRRCRAAARRASGGRRVLRGGGGAAAHGRYEVLGEIAEGGVGVVLQGPRRRPRPRRRAEGPARASTRTNPELLQRFVEEAQIGGQLQHPGIVPVYELGLDGRRAALLRDEAREGRDPRRAPRRSAATRRRTGGALLRVFEQVCQTMAYAHARGVIHRDLKPANVMVGAFGEVQVVDWGFAKVLDAGAPIDEREAPESERRPHADRDGAVGQPRARTSLAGSVMGTPAYMPPEQALGRRRAPRRAQPTSSRSARSSARS